MTRIGRSATVALGCLAAFVVLTLALIGGPLPHLDETVRHWAVTHQKPGVRRLTVDALWLGDARVAGTALAAVTAVIAWRVRRWRLLVLVLSLAVLVALAVAGLKLAVGRAPAPLAAHPDLGAGGHGYPSGHVATATVCAGLLAAVIAAHYPRLIYMAWIAATVVGAAEVLSVVYGREHWLTDAVGAALLSTAAVAAFTALGGGRLSRHRRS